MAEETTTTTTDDKTTAAPAPADYRAGLPTELRAAPALAKLDSVEALAREHINLQTLIGRKGVIPPDEKAGPEAWGKFWNELGRPESADKYELKKPDGFDGYSDDFAKAFRGWAHEAGLTAKQAAALHDKYVTHLADGMKAQNTAAAESYVKGEAALRQAWGVKYDENLELANTAIKNTPGLLDELKTMKLQNAPALAQALARAGALMRSEPGFVGGESGSRAHAGATLTPELALKEIKKLQGEIHASAGKHPYLDKGHPEHQAMVERMLQLHEMAFVEKAA